MKSFEEFEGRVDDFLAQVAGPAVGMEMLALAKGGGVFNDHYDDADRWTEEQPGTLPGTSFARPDKTPSSWRLPWRGWPSPDAGPADASHPRRPCSHVICNGVGCP